MTFREVEAMQNRIGGRVYGGIGRCDVASHRPAMNNHRPPPRPGVGRKALAAGRTGMSVRSAGHGISCRVIGPREYSVASARISGCRSSYAEVAETEDRRRLRARAERSRVVEGKEGAGRVNAGG